MVAFQKPITIQGSVIANRTTRTKSTKPKPPADSATTRSPIIAANARGFFPYTPATNLLYGLREACAMLAEEGLPNVFARHALHGAATRAAVETWGQAEAVELQCQEPADYSSSLTAVRLAEGHSADALRSLILQDLVWGKILLGFAVVAVLGALMLALNVRMIRRYD